MSRIASTHQLMIPTPYDVFRGRVYQILRRPYFVTGLMGYAAVLLLVLLYLSQKPSFKSELDLVLPGTGANSKVSLSNVGQITSQTSTPFGAGGFNPRVNYKEMLTSRGVLTRAADQMKLTIEEFGKPKVTLTEQTSILSISVLGSSPKMSQLKGWALFNALQTELDHLRADEAGRRDLSIKNVIQQYREQMNIARSAIVDFQQRSVLVSTDQFDQLVASHSTAKAKYYDAKSQATEIQRYVAQLSLNLGVSPKLASNALILQSDAEYKGYISELDTSAGQLSEFQSRWGKLHPKVKAQQLRFDRARDAVKVRSQQLFGIDDNNIFQNFTLDTNPKRAQLFADLIEAYAKEQGIVAKSKELERFLLYISDQMKVYSREVAELDRLQREFDLAEAVFTSAAARLEANKADVFASYPVIQMLATPSFATQVQSPNVAIAIVAAVMGMLFITFGLVVLWQRNTLISFLLKKS